MECACQFGQQLGNNCAGQKEMPTEIAGVDNEELAAAQAAL
jgi:hypothetical protein